MPGMSSLLFWAAAGASLWAVLAASSMAQPAPQAGGFERAFATPSARARPWVYWYFMDGHITREGLRADLEAMKAGGIGGALFLTIDVGVPRGPVAFMSPEWQDLFAGAVQEADRLGIEITLGVGPGWAGTGGPWVRPDDAMQHLVASRTPVTGGGRVEVRLPQPAPREPFFGRGPFTPDLLQAWQTYYRDVAVVAYPATPGDATVPIVDEKALYYRAPYSSAPNVRPFLEAPAARPPVPAGACLDPSRAIDLTGRLEADGTLRWDAPAGEWVVYRYGQTLTGQTSRPAPLAGLGFECDKFTTAATDAHLRAFLDPLLDRVGRPTANDRGLTVLHLDSWEQGSQNWSSNFRAEFTRRRGYDPLPLLPSYLGHYVVDADTTERFLWDVRQTARELLIENHVIRLRDYAHGRGLAFSAECYDMNPTGDLRLGSIADVPMGEFWSWGIGFNTDYSVLTAVSIAHTHGRPVVGAEAFTASSPERWQQHPARMKAQTDWAFAAGINRIVFHRYQHQPALDEYPGMRMGQYGIHWERTQTFWPMVGAYHEYLARCSDVLQTGLAVADILYLVPEGGPQVFTAPRSATWGKVLDRRGHNFDGCDPDTLLERASVADGQIRFPDGMSYRVLVLPRFETMTPRLLRKVKALLEAGATVIGPRPMRSPSLEGQPAADAEVQALARELWGEQDEPERRVGRGRLVNDVHAAVTEDAAAPAEGYRDLHADYDTTARVLASMNVPPDFASDPPLRYTHRRDGGTDLYFVANPLDRDVQATATFRSTGAGPQRWNPVTGERVAITDARTGDGVTTLRLDLRPHESAFIVFGAATSADPLPAADAPARQDIAGPWTVTFTPKWGGSHVVTMPTLSDWSQHDDPAVRFHSGEATYRATFDADDSLRAAKRAVLAIDDVQCLARVRLNGTDLGVLWCRPWEIAIPAGLLRERGNALEITVANTWANRLIGDAALPADQRMTRTSSNPFKPTDPLRPSGLIGGVRLQAGAAPATR
jgi:hypothetical protein